MNQNKRLIEVNKRMASVIKDLLAGYAIHDMRYTCESVLKDAQAALENLKASASTTPHERAPSESKVSEVDDFKAGARRLADALSASGIAVRHAQVLEALSKSIGLANWRTLRAKLDQPAVSHLDAKALLGLAKEKGLVFSDALTSFSEDLDESERKYADYARANLAQDGELEFDDPGCVVSVSEDDGAYVLGWVWVSAEDVEGGN